MEDKKYRSINYRYPNGKREIYIQQQNIEGGWSTLFVGSGLTPGIAAITYCERNGIQCDTAINRDYPESVESD